MQVTQDNTVDGRYRVLQWIIEQGDTKKTTDLLWALEQIIAELERLHPGSQGRERLRRVLEMVSTAW